MAYSAFVTTITHLAPIEGAHSIQLATILNCTVIVGSAAAVGDVGIFFPEDGQLSEEYARANDLIRRKDPATGEKVGGFFEENCRVRTQKFLGVRSEGYFAPLSSLSYTGGKTEKLSTGDMLTEFNGRQICQKYISEKTRRYNQKTEGKKKGSRKAIYRKHYPTFPEHVDTVQLAHFVRQIPVGSLITITAKYHGTSARYGNVRTFQDIPRWKQLVNRVRPTTFPTQFSSFVSGSRRVILDNARRDDGFYSKTTFRTDLAAQLDGKIAPGFVVYGEIVGWVSENTPVMAKHSTKAIRNRAYTKKYGDNIIYKYGCPPGTNKFYIYRVVSTTEDGDQIDLTPTQLSKWCDERALTAVREVWPPFIYNENTDLLNIADCLAQGEACLGEDWTDPTHLREGVVIRVDGARFTPKFYKHKNFYFKVMEGIAKEEEVDLEDAS